MTEGKVLIVGAGPTGLMFAQFLRKQGIPFQVFERDESPTERSRGWAFSLTDSMPLIQRYLPDDVPPLEKASIGANPSISTTVVVYDVQNDRVLQKLGGAKKGEKGYILTANRDSFRELLMENVPVLWSKSFSHYKEDSEGVTAFFSDGTSYRGAALVGADGARSPVRAQLLSNAEHKATQAPYITMWSNFAVNREQIEDFHKTSTGIMIGVSAGVRTVIGQRSVAADGSSGLFFSSIIFRSGNMEEDSEWAQQATQEDMYQKCCELTESFPASIKHFWHEMCEPANMFSSSVKLWEFVPPESLPKGRVTLIGDALHAMVPFRGAGANTGFRDAADLVELLIAGEADHKALDWVQVLHKYASQACPRGRHEVTASREAGEEVDGGLRRLIREHKNK